MFLALAIWLATAVTEQQVRGAIQDVAQLKALGPQMLPQLARIYTETKDEEERARIATLFYQIGWVSNDARDALMHDIHTQNQNLRIQVQWALGRVSDDTQVVDLLAGIMMNDSNAFFRDKAACALAYDQIHLTEKQKVRLYSKLIAALSDPKPQVRVIALQALNIHTGQTKGFDPNGSEEARANSIARWKQWLAEYERNL